MRLASSLRRQVRRWARHRQGIDPSPVTLRRNRIYILPTAQGIVFAALLFIMLIGAMNYNNSLGLAVTFMLAGLMVVTMHHCHRNLSGLTLAEGGDEPAFAGARARFGVLLINESGGHRFGLTLRRGEWESRAINLDPGAHARLDIDVPTTTRGRLSLQRFSVYSTFPFGLFRCWAWVHPATSTVVYPAPAPPGLSPPPEHTDTGGAQTERQGDADFAGLRPFRAGDSPRHIAWKAFAREQELLVKQYAGTDVTTHWFDFDRLTQMDVETRISQLTRWVIDAHLQGNAFGLRLPARTIRPALGPAHRQHCLTALALL